MVLSYISIPLSPSPCHRKGKGWREQLCFYSGEISILVTTTFLSLLPGHTDCISRGLVRSLPCSGTAALCAACGKTGISASDQWGAVGLNCPPAGHPLKCHLKIQPHKQNLYTPFVFVKNVSMSNIKQMLFVAKSQAPAPASIAMSLLKISRKLKRRMVGLIWLWALRWSWSSGRSSTEPDSEHGVHPMFQCKWLGVGLNNILHQITKITLTAVKRNTCPAWQIHPCGFIHGFGIFQGNGKSNPSRLPWCNWNLFH